MLDSLPRFVRDRMLTYVDERDSYPPGSLILGEAFTIGTDNRTNDYKRDECASRAAHKQRPAANAIDEEEGGECGQTVDDAVHACGEERSRVAIETQ